ncbi:hypothetical protein J4050_13040 [Winogradskyella sp. DF17]|uniref:YD repeat-containing protein n=1 Tax=Winogradskyella pelagia TaxID=2819984 RepID=A0ABS3T4L2_9FLAO|nr:hypothetical protein [Winogradskyella sp. DF17]MBO3117675.1 hypothetical protein [Winogradskyella sp. DF17]
MKTLSLKFLTILLVIGVAFTSCSDDDDNNYIDPNALEDIDIVIDQTQTFNMTMFVMSFEQMFGSDARWTWDYSHDVQDGKALTSYQNFKVVGEFGDGVFTINHDFNSDGVITSSTRIETYDYDDDDEITFTYLYDTEGKIVQLTKEKYGQIRDIVEMEYNTNNELVKKIHRGDYNYSDGEEEIFTYNTDGTVKSYENESWGETYNYTYTNGNMTRQEENDNGNIYVEIFEYDTQGRVINYYDEGDIYDNRAFEYYDTYFREIDYDEYNGTRRIDDMTDYSAYDVDLKRWDFDYDGAVFEFCKTREFFYVENGNMRLVSKKEYFEGTPENLVLVGYVTVDTRDAANDYKKTKESIYDANGVLLYYVTYEVVNNSIQSHQVYLPDGTAIEDHEMDDLMWMEELISDLDIT